MAFAQSGFERLPLSPLTDPAGRAATRQPITVAMRVAHRLSAFVRTKPQCLRNTTAIVSFSFDDVPESAVSLGAPILEAFGARGTFFISTGLLGHITPDWRLTDAEGVARLASGGHEIALHTHGHRPLAALRRRAFIDDLRICAVAMDALVPGKVSANFAYPYGFGHLAHSRCLKGAVRSSRTTHPGLNVGWCDLHLLKSFAFGTSLDDPAAVDRLLDQAAERGGWLIFTGHDVVERPSPYGCTPSLLAHALRGAAARRLTVAPIDRALDLCDVAPFDGATQEFAR